jgi:hypothetical protein
MSIFFFDLCCENVILSNLIENSQRIWQKKWVSRPLIVGWIFL